MNQIQKNLIRMKNTLALAVLMTMGTLLVQCDGKDHIIDPEDQENETPVPTPKPEAKVKTIVVTSQNDATSDINYAAEVLSDSVVSGVVLDMNSLRALELKNENLTTAIHNLVTASDKNASKQVKVMVPKISVKGNVKIPTEFYEFTRGSTKYTKSTFDDNAPAAIVVAEDGSLHFEGELKSNELLTVLSAIESKSLSSDQPRISADSIKITERMGTMSDGPAYGLPMWAIFKLVKTNNISAVLDKTNHQSDGSAQTLFEHLGNEGQTKFNGTENLLFYEMGDQQLLRSSTPIHRRDAARVVFDKPINMKSEMFTDTVRMGGQWKNGIWTPDTENWTAIISESQMTYGRPVVAYPADYLRMTAEQQKQEKRLVIHTNGAEVGSDTIIDGVKRDWVNLEEIIAFHTTVATGAANIKWKPGKPLAVRVPSERTPAELKAPINGELHSWDNFFFYDCRIDVNNLPGNVTPIYPVVDKNMKLDLTRANKARSAIRGGR